MKPFGLHDIGCYIDGCRGIYIDEILQKLAIAYGWQGEPSLDTAADDYYDAGNEALEFLNTLCDDDVCFILDDGLILEAIDESLIVYGIK